MVTLRRAVMRAVTWDSCSFRSISTRSVAHKRHIATALDAVNGTEGPSKTSRATPFFDVKSMSMLEELSKRFDNLNKFVPGLAASGVVMAGGSAVAETLGQALLTAQGVTGASPISAIPVAIVLGAFTRAGLAPLLKQAAGNSKAAEDAVKRVEPGAKFASATVLRGGIICIGAKLSALDLVTVGLTGIPAIAASMTAGLMIIPRLANHLELPEKMGKLISVGTSICGVTAISATAPVIKAEQRETAFAVANVVGFGTLGMLTYPYLAHSVFTHSEQVGLFLGIAVHDTSQVMGSALTYHNVYCDETALKVAAVTKLSRNLCLAGVVPAMALKSSGQPMSLKLDDVKKLVPGFVLGFVAVSALRTIGDATLGWSGSAFCLVNAMQWKALTDFIGNVAAPTLLGVAMAGLGLSMNPSTLRGVGPRPFVAGFLGAMVVGGTGLAAALALPHVISLGPAKE